MSSITLQSIYPIATGQKTLTVVHDGTPGFKLDWNITTANIEIDAQGRIRKKAGGNNNWNAEAHSVKSYTGGAFVQFTPAQANNAIMIGLNSNPSITGGFGNLDYAFYLMNNGQVGIYESGASRGIFGNYSAGDEFTITYDNKLIRYYVRGALVRYVEAPADKTFHVGSVFRDQKDTYQIYDLYFAPVGRAGEDGKDGLPGPKGVSLRTRGEWSPGVAYVNDDSFIDIVTRNGSTFSCRSSHTSTSDNGPSTVYPPIENTYWTPIAFRGAQGPNGVTLYTWIKYADDVNGSGMSDSPAGKKYMGIAYNKTTPTKSTNPTDYSWSLIQGPEGKQGIPGTPGKDGQTLYTWIKYADSPTSGMSTSPIGKKYIGIAYNKNSPIMSNNYSDYAWSLIEGPQGIQGVSFRNQGAWEPTRTYERNNQFIDTVSYNGSLFACKVASSLNTPPPEVPTSNDHWELLVARGARSNQISWRTRPADNMAVNDIGIWKKAGESGWNSEAYSLESYVGGCVLAFKAGTTDKAAMIGLSTNPWANTSYTHIDFCWYLRADGRVEIYESNNLRSIGTVYYKVGDRFHILYQDNLVKYYHNGKLMRTATTTAGRRFYIDSSFDTVGTSPVFYDITFDHHTAFLDWVQNWDSAKVEIKGDAVLTPKIFVGNNGGTADNPILTGIAIGRDILGGTDATIGIAGYNANTLNFKLNPDGSAWFGRNPDRRFTIHADGSVSMPKITVSEVAADFGRSLDLSSNVAITQRVTSTEMNNALADVKAYADAKVDGIEIGGRNLILNSNTLIKFPNMEIIPTDGTVGEIEVYGDERGRNLLRNSNNFINYIRWAGSNATFTTGVSVTEWGATDATRIQTSGGTHVVKLVENIVMPSAAGQQYTVSVWVKNVGNYPVVVDSNLGNSIVNVGEQRRVIITATGNGISNLQVQFLTTSDNISNPLDFIVWRAKGELGNTPTPWTPAPEDFNNTKGVLYNLSTDIESNTWYTLSVKTDIVNDFIGVWLGNSFVGFLDDNNTITFKTTTDNRYRTIILKSLKEEGTIEWVKLEKGNKATDWTPAPEDVEEGLKKIEGEIDSIGDSINGEKGINKKINDINAILEGINTKLENKADSGLISILQTTIDNIRTYIGIKEDEATENLETLLTRIVGLEIEVGKKSTVWEFINNKLIGGEEGIFFGNKNEQTGIFIQKDKISFYNGSFTEPISVISNNIMKIHHGVFVKTLQIGEHLIKTDNNGVTSFYYAPIPGGGVNI